MNLAPGCFALEETNGSSVRPLARSVDDELDREGGWSAAGISFLAPTVMPPMTSGKVRCDEGSSSIVSESEQAATGPGAQIERRAVAKSWRA
jgi:hypothetical protein